LGIETSSFILRALWKCTWPTISTL
jgi:hypothetical protein